MALDPEERKRVIREHRECGLNTIKFVAVILAIEALYSVLPKHF